MRAALGTGHVQQIERAVRVGTAHGRRIGLTVPVRKDPSPDFVEIAVLALVVVVALFLFAPPA